LSEVYIEIISSNNNNTYVPLIEGELSIESHRSSVPSKAVFNVVKDEKIDFGEGSPVSIYADKKPMFKGYVFTKSRTKDKLITVTAYDQTRYLKNKGTYIFNGFELGDIVKQIALDYKIDTGEIEKSGFSIADLTCDRKTLFDIIQSAVDITYESTGKLFVLYDDFGKLCVKNIESMSLDYIVRDDTAQNIDYTSSIDNRTYNQIRLTSKGKKGIVQEYFKKSDENINKWGILQYSGSVGTGENGEAKASKMLDIYGSIKRKLGIKGAFGNADIRAGSVIQVKTEATGDIVIDEKMIVEHCRHRFKNGIHTMDIDLKGGIINDA